MKNILLLTFFLALAGCKIPDKGIVETTAPPFINQATLSPILINVNRLANQPTDPVDSILIVMASIDNPDAGVPVTVTYTLLDPSGNLLNSETLLDNGVPPDLAANDGKYTTRIHFHVLKQDVGVYTVQFQAINSMNYRSNTIVQTLLVKNSDNHHPVISNLTMPDSVRIPPKGDTTFVKTTIIVSDSDGLGDIVSVTLTSSDTSKIIVGIFPMFDDGGKVVQPPLNFPSGDAIANDGIYTLVIPLIKAPSEGVPTYRDFSFTAKDRTGDTSNTITKRIYIQ